MSDEEVDDASQQMSAVTLAEKPDKGSVTDDEPDEAAQEKFNRLITKAKRYVEQGQIENALRLNKKALQIHYSEKLAKKVRKMEDYIKANADESSEDDSGMIHLGKGFYLYEELYSKLYPHQQEGVLWLWSLFRRKKGGILGDDMGLGKTIQVIGFLSGMFDMHKINSVLIVLPVAVMVNWEKEFNKWAPGLKVHAYHGSSKREKERALAKVQRRGGICLTTYGLVVTSWQQLGEKDGSEFVWDYMILDEGHKIKNPTKTSKGVHAIPALNRVILTGTPVQNNLKELWSLFDFVHQGSLLGTQRTFKMEFENPITRAREKDATVGEKRLGMEMAESLKKIISPYFLRRTKAEVKQSENKENEDPDNGRSHKQAVMPTLTRKNDLIVWTFISDTQLKIYKDFLELDSVKELLMTTKSPLVALTVLKKICDHPRLLSTRACAQLGIEGDDGLDEELLETEAGNLSAVTRIQHVDDSILLRESGKLTFLVGLLDQLKREGHRTLVFSYSRKMLDIMQKVISNRGHRVMRLDGTISQVQEREQRIRKWQNDSSYSVFLLTTQVGGVGLTLTAADRVVIFDPSWNPASDAQAVDRVFRIGQEKNVVIYRLITCGTVEEKIYRRQIFKDSITKQTTGKEKNPYRYFSKYELKELFILDDPHSSTTQQALEQMHSSQRLTDPTLDEHIAFLYSLNMYGLSDHDLMFSQASGEDQDMAAAADVSQPAPEDNYIQHRVQKARELIQMESLAGSTLEVRLGKVPGAAPPNGGIKANQFTNWNFPKPEIPEGSQGQPVRPTEIDLTHTESPVPTLPIHVKNQYPPGGDLEDDLGDDLENEIDLTSPSPAVFAKATVKKEGREDEIDLTDTPLIDDQTPIRKHLIANTPKRQAQELSSRRLDVDDQLVHSTSPSITHSVIKQEPAINVKQQPHDSPLRNITNSDPGSGKQGRLVSVTNQDSCDSPTIRSPLRDIFVKSESDTENALLGGRLNALKSPHTPRTPIRDRSMIVEELIISPDAHCPIVQTQRQKSLSDRYLSLQGVEPKLNFAEQFACGDGKQCNKKSNYVESNEGSNGLEAEVDSPYDHSHKIMVEESPIDNYSDKTSRSNPSAETSMEQSVLEETVEESVFQSDIDSDDEEGNLHKDIKSILEKSLCHAGNEMNESLPDIPADSPIRATRRSCGKPKKRAIESSDEDDEEYDPDKYSSDSDRKSTKSSPEENSYKRQRRSMECSAETVETNESDTDGLNDGSEESVGDEVDTEEDDGEESEGTDDELDGFEALPMELQERYNQLVESARELCQQKEYLNAQSHVLEALSIYPDPELQNTSLRIQMKIRKQQQKQQQ